MGILTVFLLMILAVVLRDYGPRSTRSYWDPGSKRTGIRPSQKRNPMAPVGLCEGCGMLMSQEDSECVRCGASNPKHAHASDTSDAFHREVGRKAAQAYARANSCPQCGANAKRTLTYADRVTTAGYVGTAGKQYVCDACKHMW